MVKLKFNMNKDKNLLNSIEFLSFCIPKYYIRFMTLDFTNKVVLVTGGSRGIGRAIAAKFAAKGATVIINYINNDAVAHATVDSFPKGDHAAIKADISNPDLVRKLINKVALDYGRLDVVINNVGIHEWHEVDKVNYETWQKIWRETIDTNLIAAANISYCAAQYMIQQGGGRIVNVSSRGAFRGEPQQPAYGASKAGLNAMSQSLAQSLARHKIFVGIVAPGFVETDLTKDILSGPKGDDIRRQSPFNRVAKPEEVANAVLFLASEGTEFMTGTIIDVNGASYLRS